MANGSASTTLENATRSIPKATYVPLLVPAHDSNGGRATLKFGFIRQLSLQPGEVDAVRKDLAASPGSASLPWDILSQFEGMPMPSQLPSPSAFANVPSSAMLDFGKAVVAVRQRSMDQARQLNPHAEDPSTTPVKASPALASAARSLSLTSAPLGTSLNLTNLGLVATNAFEANVTATPIGMLNLERMEMTPAGIERGELLATIPLAPKEQTAVVQKEWSVTTKEFTSIVTDSLENYSETGVTENTDLSQSTTSQTQHSNQFNINSTVSGGIGFVSGSVSAGFSAQDSASQSATDSRKHALETTRKASSRVKQEHKTTISATTVTGSSETSTRILQNPSDTDPMRIDYFSLMRKWRVQLYRYGLRLTYDIAIPNPGGTLREAYMLLADLQSQVATGFSFPLQYSDITLAAYADPSSRLWTYANRWGAQVPPPPQSVPDVFVHDNPTNTDPNVAKIEDMPPVPVPAGYWIEHLFFSYHFESHTGPNNGKLRVLFSAYPEANFPQHDGGPDDLTTFAGFLLHASGNPVVSLRLENTTNVSVSLRIVVTPTDALVQQWQSNAWNALYSAGQTAFYAQQQSITAQIQAIRDQINNIDTLTLRREENDEIMKGVLRWLLGPSFDFMPPDVIALFGNPAPGTSAYDLLTHGVSFTGNDLFSGAPSLWPGDWSTMFQYQEMVKFVNEAIEWENVLYFLYSYFWDVPASWDFIRQIQHPDATRQAFLRAGSARIVLTVRKGWETAWINFVEAGKFGQTLLPGHPYLTIAQEIQDYDNTNYPGLPPANPASNDASAGSDSVATLSHVQIVPSVAPVTLAVDSSAGFIVGYSAVIDTYESGAQETQVITAVPDASHITLQLLANPHNGTTSPFPVLQPGEKGVLIGQWYEYTPTSGTDIAVTSDLATIA